MKSPEIIAELVPAAPGMPARRYRPQDLDFLPEAIDLAERPVSIYARIITLTIIALVASTILWASLARLDIVAIADGKTVTDGEVKTIQPLEIGTVRRILVNDGQHVATAEVLIEMDSTSSVAELDRIRHDLAQAHLDEARLEALLTDQPMKLDGSPDVAAGDTQQRILAAERQAQIAKLAGIDREVDRNHAEQANVEATIAKLEVTMPLMERRVAGRKELYEKQVGSLFTYLELQQQYVGQQHDLTGMRHHLDEVTNAGGALRRRREEAEADFRRDVLDRLVKARQQADQLSQEEIKARQRIELQTLRAPVAGTVQQLSVHTVGGVVTPAQPLLVVVPDDLKVQVEARVANRDIGFVHQGQEAEIKLATFDFTRYGVLRGTVVAVSRDAVPPNEKEQKLDREPQYAARIALERGAMQVDGREIALTPGMMATVEIKTGKRRVIDYLLSPVMRFRDALRER